MSSDIGGRWRRIPSLLWWEDRLQRLDNDHRVICFYAKTGPQSTSVGCYRMSTAVAVEDLGNVTPVEFDHRLSVVCEAFGWRFDVQTRVLWMPEWLAENPPQSPNVCKSWRKLLTNVPDCDVKFEAAHAVVRALRALPKNPQAFLEAFGELPKEWAISKAKPEAQPKASPKAKTDWNQGAVDQGIQGSVRERAGALRAAGSEGQKPKSGKTNGNLIDATSPLVTFAQRTLELTPNGTVDEQVDTLQWLVRQQSDPRLDCKRTDAISALNIAKALPA
jgi:hypothetical protein